MIVRVIIEYNENFEHVTHINRHKASMLGTIDNDKNLTLVFPLTLEGTTSAWFLGLPALAIDSWKDVRICFMEHFMGEDQRFKSVMAMDEVKKQHEKSLANIYERFHKYVSDNERWVEIV